MTITEIKDKYYITQVKCLNDFWQLINRVDNTVVMEGSKEFIKKGIEILKKS